MAEFCETCPIRGECIGDIEDEITLDVRYSRRAKPLLVAQCFDDEGNGSELFRAVDGDIFEKLEDCQNPATIQVPTGIVSNKTEEAQVCGALGDLPYVKDFPGLEARFNYGLKVLDGTAQIDEIIDKVESKRLLRVLKAAGALTVVSLVSLTVGDLIENVPAFEAGFWGIWVGVGTFLGTLMKTINNLEKETN